MAIEKKFILAPSILGADPLSVGSAVDSLKGNWDWLHLDIMDGHFVRNFSFGPAMVEALRKKYEDAFLDVHLMINELDYFLPKFADAGASQISIHAEVSPQLLHGRLSWIHKRGIKAGVVIAPATTVESLRYVLPLADLVLVMSVTPGSGGQSLIESSFEKTRLLSRLRSEEGRRYLIQMDGGIKLENARIAAEAGCDALVMGSAVFSSFDPSDYLAKTRNELKNMTIAKGDL
ncbi:ribulose-phosphate 3-epimerase [Synergistales bacterium]|nr:ribulose-phosphate 3-epimerase [Synergistales bacterium]